MGEKVQLISGTRSSGLARKITLKKRKKKKVKFIPLINLLKQKGGKVQ